MPPKKQHQCIKDMISWTEAFTIFALVLTSYFLHQWKDLTLYKLMILQIHRQFKGRVSLAYDQAFRENAEATRLSDWSELNSLLFSFHSSGLAALNPNIGSVINTSEPTGSKSSLILCISWNKRHCTAPYKSYRYHHRCSNCFRAHRVLLCFVQATFSSRCSTPDQIAQSLTVHMW